jgi:O-antigen/teichoic acid export membrane protein
MVTGASGMVIAQTSILVGQYKLGLAGAGAITLASTIAIYADRVDGIVTATLYPAICAVRDRAELLFETFVKSNRLALMWGVPFGVGVALFAADLIDFGIGERWRPALGLIQAFGLIAAANHIGFNWTAFYRARGETRPIAVISVVTMVVFVAVAIPLLASDGLRGLALGMGITTAVSLALRTWYLTRLFPGFRMAHHAARAIAPTVPAAGAVLALRAATGAHRTLGLAIAEVALYLALTVIATLALERPLLREMLGYLRRGRAAARPRIAT